MFDIRIINLNVGSYLCMTPKKDLANAEKAKKGLYLQACLEHRRSFTPMVYSMDGIPGAEALATYRRLAALLRFNMKQEYFELCGFLRVRMSPTIVKSNSLLLCGPQDKEARISQRPELKNGVVMALIVPWRG